MRRTTLSVFALSAAAALSLTACGGGGSSSPSTSGSAAPTSASASASGSASAPAAGGEVKLLKPGTLTVCSDIPYIPFEFEKDGKTVGFDMDIAAEVAKTVGAELKVVDSSFDIIQSGLFKTDCDIAISGLSITEARKANIDFSTPYLDDDLVLVAKEGSGITDLNSAKGKTVGVQSATTGEEYAKKEGIEATGFDDGGLQVQALLAGTTDASLGNQSILRYGIKDNPEYKVVQEIKTGEQLGIGVAKGNTALLEKVNETLKTMQDGGKMDELKKTWFGDAAS